MPLRSPMFSVTRGITEVVALTPPTLVRQVPLCKYVVGRPLNKPPRLSDWTRPCNGRGGIQTDREARGGGEDVLLSIESGETVVGGYVGIMFGGCLKAESEPVEPRAASNHAIRDQRLG